MRRAAFTVTADGSYAARLALDGGTGGWFPERWTLDGPEPYAVPLPGTQPEEPDSDVLPLSDGRVLIRRKVAERHTLSLLYPTGPGTGELQVGAIECARLSLLPPAPGGTAAYGLVHHDRSTALWLLYGGAFGPERIAEVAGHCTGGAWLDRTGRLLALDRELDGRTKTVIVDLGRGGEISTLLQITEESDDRLLLADPYSGLLLVRSDAPGHERLGWGVLGSARPVRFPECLRLPNAVLTPFAAQPGQELAPEGCAVAFRIEGPTGSWVGVWRPAARRLQQFPAPAGWLVGTGLWTAGGELRLPYVTPYVRCGLARLRLPDADRDRARGEDRDTTRTATPPAAGPNPAPAPSRVPPPDPTGPTGSAPPRHLPPDPASAPAGPSPTPLTRHLPQDPTSAQTRPPIPNPAGPSGSTPPHHLPPDPLRPPATASLREPAPAPARGMPPDPTAPAQARVPNADPANPSPTAPPRHLLPDPTSAQPRPLAPDPAGSSPTPPTRHLPQEPTSAQTRPPIPDPAGPSGSTPPHHLPPDPASAQTRRPAPDPASSSGSAPLRHLPPDPLRPPATASSREPAPAPARGVPPGPAVPARVPDPAGPPRSPLPRRQPSGPAGPPAPAPAGPSASAPKPGLDLLEPPLRPTETRAPAPVRMTDPQQPDAAPARPATASVPAPARRPLAEPDPVRAAAFDSAAAQARTAAPAAPPGRVPGQQALTPVPPQTLAPIPMQGPVLGPPAQRGEPEVWTAVPPSAYPGRPAAMPDAWSAAARPVPPVQAAATGPSRPVPLQQAPLGRNPHP
ncbi:hypothetical protein QZH56_25935 [Streptomyces olivoreticuli]|uniref:hypothetical protein n=1 Tax=Streptomyces olivoreticuli TaxID=68246 RepID=UPI002659ECB9|nr:hypothetical protein [Streptomyces olivoreticuli]WKK22215.1 hypothetical protein QZH56_25935 [Streptomyces olivoreticuli]